MISQDGHSSFTLAVKNGLSWFSWRAVFFSGSRSAIFSPLPPPDDAALVLEPLDVPPLSSLEPQPAPTTASAVTSRTPAVARGWNLGNISPPRKVVVREHRTTGGLDQQEQVDYTSQGRARKFTRRAVWKASTNAARS